MAGITLEHDGKVTVKDVQKTSTGSLNISKSDDHNGSVSIPVSPIFNFFLAPRIVIGEIRENSPAFQAGLLKGDEVIAVNGKPSYKYKLYEFAALFSSKAGKTIYITIDREGKLIKKKFKLKELL